MRYFSGIALLLIGPLAAGAGHTRAQTADEIIEKHIAALGGRPALGKIVSRRSTGAVTLSVQGNDLAGSYEAFAKAPNKTRIVLKLDLAAVGGPGEMVLDQRFDGVNAVVSNSMQGDATASGNQLENMRNGGFPSAMLTYKERGVKADLLPREKIGAQELIVVQLTPKAGSTLKAYFDPATYMVVRTSAKISTPEVGELEQVIEFMDYRTVDGIKVAFHTVNSTPVQKVTVKLDKVEHNVTMDDAMFTKK